VTTSLGVRAVDTSLFEHKQQVGYVYVAEIVSNNQSGAGWWPDPLLRVPRAFGIDGVTSSLWFTVHAAPHATAASTAVYTTTVTLTATSTDHDGGDNASFKGNEVETGGGGELHTPTETIDVQVGITVYGFNLPTTPKSEPILHLLVRCAPHLHNQHDAAGLECADAAMDPTPS
jgi:hypothetical protein